MVFSPGFQRTLVNSLAQKDRHLHAAARKAVESVAAAARDAEEPALRVALAAALQRQGGAGFDALTHTSATAQLLQVTHHLPSVQRVSSEAIWDHFAFRMGQDCVCSVQCTEVHHVMWCMAACVRGYGRGGCWMGHSQRQ